MYIESDFIREDVHLQWGRYPNGQIALQMYAEDGIPVATVTVALEKHPDDGCSWFKNWSGYEGLPEALAKAGVIELTGRRAPTGYVNAQEGRWLIPTGGES